MMKEIMEMIERIELVTIDISDDNIIDIFVDDTNVCDWEEIKGLNKLLSFIAKNAIKVEHHLFESLITEYHLIDNLTVNIFSLASDD